MLKYWQNWNIQQIFVFESYIFDLIRFLLTTLPLYIIFNKAGEDGGKAIVPIYKYYVLDKVSFSQLVWFLFAIQPTIASVIAYTAIPAADAYNIGAALAGRIGLGKMTYDLSKRFHKNKPFCLMGFLLPEIALFVLAFGNNNYHWNY